MLDDIEEYLEEKYKIKFIIKRSMGRDFIISFKLNELIIETTFVYDNNCTFDSNMQRLEEQIDRKIILDVKKVK